MVPGMKTFSDNFARASDGSLICQRDCIYAFPLGGAVAFKAGDVLGPHEVLFGMPLLAVLERQGGFAVGG